MLQIIMSRINVERELSDRMARVDANVVKQAASVKSLAANMQDRNAADWQAMQASQQAMMQAMMQESQQAMLLSQQAAREEFVRELDNLTAGHAQTRDLVNTVHNSMRPLREQLTEQADRLVRLEKIPAVVANLQGQLTQDRKTVKALTARVSRLEQCATLPVRSEHRVVIIHGAVASAQDMKLQLQAEVALNIARTQKQQEDARALAALVEQKLQTEAAKRRGNEKCLEKLQHTARETKRQLQDETAFNCGRDQALSARTTELEWSFRREADKLRGNEESLAHLEEHLTLEMRCKRGA